MKKVLSAGVVLLAVASLLTARAQTESAPQASPEVSQETKPKSSKRTGATTKTAKTSSSKATKKRTPAAAQGALKASAKDPAAYYEIGMGHYESKRFKEAVEAFKQAIRLGSTEPKTYFNLGQAYYSLNLYKEARESYKRAVRLKADWAEAHYQLGWMYHILGDKDSSQSQYKVLQTLNPEMAARFQKLLDDDEQAAKATVPGATARPANDATANSKDQTPASVPEPDATDKTQAAAVPGKIQEAASSAETLQTAAAPSDVTTKQSATNPNGAGPNAADASANAGGTPAKDETATSEPSASASELPPTSIYRVGIGDVLDIRLLNSPTSRSTLFTVMSGGLIEYPLAGGSFKVAGLTTDEVGTRLAAELKRRGIGDQSSVVVAVRDYTSHSVIVSGLVNYPGTKILRREAVPLYVIIAEAQLRPDAGRAVIMRAGETIPINDLSDPLALNVLVKPGDVLTIYARQLQYYFIGGRINSPGQKIHQPGITLIQAILAAGGLSRSQDTVEISRAEQDGRLTTTKYVLKEIKSGKVADPRIQPGDRIEVGQ